MNQNDKQYVIEQYKILQRNLQEGFIIRIMSDLFFIGINTCLLIYFGKFILLNNENLVFLILLTITAMAICLLWKQLSKEISRRNSLFYRITMQLEEELFIESSLRKEWNILGENNRRKELVYSISVSKILPYIFALGFIFLTLMKILNFYV